MDAEKYVVERLVKTENENELLRATVGTLRNENKRLGEILEVLKKHTKYSDTFDNIYISIFNAFDENEDFEMIKDFFKLETKGVKNDSIGNGKEV